MTLTLPRPAEIKTAHISNPNLHALMNTVQSLKTLKKNVGKIVDAELESTGGLLRLAPAWVPRSFLQPGKRLKLHPDDLYAYGLNRGGIDERWFASTTPAANEGRVPDEGYSYVVAGETRFTLAQAVAECGATLIGSKIWGKYKKWPVYSKFFDNMGPIPHHMHQSKRQAARITPSKSTAGTSWPRAPSRVSTIQSWTAVRPLCCWAPAARRKSTRCRPTVK